MSYSFNCRPLKKIILKQPLRHFRIGEYDEKVFLLIIVKTIKIVFVTFFIELFCYLKNNFRTRGSDPLFKRGKYG